MYALTVHVLGPLEVAVGGSPVAVTAGRLRTLLVALALSAGRVASMERLASVVWDQEPPGDVRRSLQTYVGRLRTVLGAERIVRHKDGYLLDVEADAVDALRFERLLSGGDGGRRALLTEAIGLWRGEPFQDVASEWLARHEAPRLWDRFLGAVERLADLDLASPDGDHRATLDRLESLTARHPLREPLWARLLTALSVLGRPAEALSRYEELRARIAEELGVDPSTELRRVHAELLHGRPHRSTPTTAAVPRQLPATLSALSGRRRQLRELDARLGHASGTGARVVVISGAAGIGKTTLALHWAQSAADRFPDGQLYADLRGFAPSGRPADPVVVAEGFLDALGAPVGDLPPEPDARFASYRSLTAGKRLLVVLDNARDAEQVRPLLPGGAGTVVVTSRDHLTGLVASHAAHPIGLDLLTTAEAQALLCERIGSERAMREPGAVADIAAVCGGLPLALAVVAARAAARPDRPLAGLVTGLRRVRDRLDLLESGDPSVGVRAALSWSYRILRSPVARMLRLLAVHPGPEVSVPAAASLAALRERDAARLLAELATTHLVTEPAPGRYGLHDLVREYAAERAAEYDTDTERGEAAVRVLDHYLHSAMAADERLHAFGDPMAMDPPRPGVVPERPTGQPEALAWLRTEHEVLVGMVAFAAASGNPGHTWRMALALNDYLDMQGHWQDWQATAEMGAEAAHHCGDPAAEARILRLLGRAAQMRGQYDRSDELLERAIGLYAEAGDRVGLGHAFDAVSHHLIMRGRYAEALPFAERALASYGAAGYEPGRARSSNTLGWTLAMLGEYEAALEHCGRALDGMPDIDHRGQAMVLDSLGYVHHKLGNLGEAAGYYRRALALLDGLGNRYFMSSVLTALAEVHLEEGETADARECYREALGILDALGHRDAEAVRARLAAAESAATRT